MSKSLTANLLWIVVTAGPIAGARAQEIEIEPIPPVIIVERGVPFAQIRAVFAAHLSELSWCVRSIGGARPSLVQPRLEMVIERDGRVRFVRVRAKNPEVARCAEERIARWRFPQSDEVTQRSLDFSFRL